MHNARPFILILIILEKGKFAFNWIEFMLSAKTKAKTQCQSWALFCYRKTIQLMRHGIHLHTSIQFSMLFSRSKTSGNNFDISVFLLAIAWSVSIKTSQSFERRHSNAVGRSMLLCSDLFFPVISATAADTSVSFALSMSLFPSGNILTNNWFDMPFPLVSYASSTLFAFVAIHSSIPCHSIVQPAKGSTVRWNGRSILFYTLIAVCDTQTQLNITYQNEIRRQKVCDA